MRLSVSGVSPQNVFRGLTEVHDTAELILDLSHLYFVKPPVLSTLAAVVDALCVQHNPAVSFIAPTSGSCCVYLERMDFGHFLDRLQIEHQLPPVVHHASANDRLCELTRLGSSDSHYAKLAELVSGKAYQLGVDAKLTDQLYSALYELCDNAVTHAATPWAFASAQTYDNVIQLCVSDMGKGIRQSFSGTQHQPKDDREAIQLAASMRVSSLGPERGIGLATLIRDVGLLGGNVEILSGAFSLSYGAGILNGVQNVPNSNCGTTVAVEIPLQEPHAVDMSKV